MIISLKKSFIYFITRILQRKVYKGENRVAGKGLDIGCLIFLT